MRAPGDARVRLALGALLRRQGRTEEAVPVLRAAVMLAPGLASARHELGRALRGLGKVAEAEAMFRAALTLEPGSAIIANDLGSLLSQQGRAAEAVPLYQSAVAIDPRFAGGFSNLCAALAALGRIEEAVEAGGAAVRLRPDDADAQSNFGAALAQIGRYEEALAACRAAIEAQPGHANAHANLGLALRGLERPDEAIAALHGALRLDASHLNARIGLAMTLLAVGRLEEGFEAYEHRLPPRPAGLPAGLPRWRGEALAGRTILLQAEQGLGDTIQFVRYVPEVARRGGRVLLAAPAQFARLLAGLPGLEALLHSEEPAPPADVRCALLSLPHVLGTTLESVPAPVPYLRAEAEALDRWRERLAGLPGLRVGLAWAGNPHHQGDYGRSIAPSRLAALWEVPGVSWVSLQVGARADALRGLAPDGAVLDLAPALTDLAETAAAMAQIDLIVTVDTAVAHLAGALGRPVWTMLPVLPDWRWLLRREDTPWYPTMRLFRQARAGEWEEVIARVAEGIAELVRRRRTSPG
nr:tetratricopeptide repeat-containing glycosyltransferase family protein [Siccirubricoccus soli]